MKKGFMHIVEIIIISLLVIVVVFQLYQSVPTQGFWDRAQLRTLSGDILHSLEAAGMEWTDRSGMEAELIRLLGRTNIIFDLEIENLPKPDLWVGCVCTEEEYAEYTSLLTGSQNRFTLNGMAYEIRLERIDPDSIDFPLLYDIIIIGESTGILEASQRLMEKFLLAGRGIILVKDLSQSDFELDETLLNIFGLEFDSQANPSSPKLAFNTPPESRYYNIRKYFLAIPNVTGNPDSLDDFVNESFKFDNFLSPSELVYASENDENRVLLATEATPSAAALVVRDKVYQGKGRTAWLSGDAQGSLSDQEERTVLLKSLTLWSSGERFHITGHEIKNPEKSYLIDVIKRQRYLNPSLQEQVIQKTTFFHPLKIVLSLGYALK